MAALTCGLFSRRVGWNDPRQHFVRTRRRFVVDSCAIKLPTWMQFTIAPCMEEVAEQGTQRGVMLWYLRFK